ncbi:hypothetical protein DRJ54_00070 [Candidatus Acetothermia bacterium]|nr:MAG: hypothetical protein DRJ54_00070 [Candidatus Acetothermia bacterium]
MAGGMLVGYGIGYGIGLATGTRSLRVAGLLLGLASGLWTAARILRRVAWNGKRGDTHT